MTEPEFVGVTSMTEPIRTVARTAASARTVETNFADALAELLSMIGDTDNAATHTTDFEGSFSSPIIRAEGFRTAHTGAALVQVEFEDGSVLHLTVTQVKESNQ